MQTLCAGTVTAATVLCSGLVGLYGLFILGESKSNFTYLIFHSPSIQQPSYALMVDCPSAVALRTLNHWSKGVKKLLFYAP